MEFTINQLSSWSGVSTRTLRYYDAIDLLKPARIADSGYRFYGQSELDRLQQILLYREMDFPLAEIRELLAEPDFGRARALEGHLARLQEKRRRIDRLIETVRNSIAESKGERKMTESEKFKGFKQSIIDENERLYGAEARELYGDEAVDSSNQGLMEKSEEEFAQIEDLNAALELKLKEAFATGDPGGELAREACELHKRWLSFYNPNYSKEYHLLMADMYVEDERFKAYYDRLAPGMAEFLKEAIVKWSEG